LALPVVAFGMPKSNFVKGSIAHVQIFKQNQLDYLASGMPSLPV
jgi:hypothetical protein